MDKDRVGGIGKVISDTKVKAIAHKASGTTLRLPNLVQVRSEIERITFKG